VITPRELLGRPAIVSAYLVPILFIGGTTIAALAWPGYDPIRQTISELATVGAPTAAFTTAIFVLTGLGHLVTVSFARGIGWAGRIAYLVGALGSLGVAAFPLPADGGHSIEHTISATVGFVLLAAWPVLGMRRRRDYPWLIRPLGALLGTVLMAIFCFWFLIVWTSTTVTDIGLVDRLAADTESIWPAVVVTALWIRARRLPAVETASTAD